MDNGATAEGRSKALRTEMDDSACDFHVLLMQVIICDKFGD